MEYVLNGQHRAGITSDVSVTGLYVLADEPPAVGEKLVVDVPTRAGEVLRLHGRVAGRAVPGETAARGASGFAFALEAYNEEFERLVLALSAPSVGRSGSKRKAPAALETEVKPAPEAPLIDAGLVHILLADPSERHDLLLREVVSKIEVGSYRVEWVSGVREALAALEQRRHEIAFVSWRLAPSGGVALIRRAVAAGCETPLVLLTNVHDRTLEMEAIREGAADAIDLAHLDADTLERSIRYALERARIQVERRAAERELEELYDKAPCGLQLLDEAGVIVRINDTALSWLGYEREELVGVRRFTDLLEPGCVPRYHEYYRWFLEPGRLRDLSLELRRKGGGLMTVSASAAIVRKPGRPPGSRWTLLDTTEQREREAALRRLAKAVEMMQLGVTVTDLYGTILYVNPAAAGMSGYTVAELIGASTGLLPPEELRRLLETHRLGTSPRWKRDGQWVRLDGSVLPVHLVSDVVTDELGAPIAIVTCCEERLGPPDRLTDAARATFERLIEQLGSAETTIRNLSALLLARLTGDDESSVARPVPVLDAPRGSGSDGG